MKARRFWFIGIVLALLTSFLIYKKIERSQIENEIKENKFTTIAQIYNYHNGKSSNGFYSYYYFYKGVKYSDTRSVSNLRGRRDEIGKFFRIELSTLNPSHSLLLGSQEVIDSSEITRAGFELAWPER